MGREAKAKFDRREVRKVVGDEAAFWTFQCYGVLFVRGFFGRLKWLFFGK